MKGGDNMTNAGVLKSAIENVSGSKQKSSIAKKSTGEIAKNSSFKKVFGKSVKKMSENNEAMKGKIPSKSGKNNVLKNSSWQKEVKTPKKEGKIGEKAVSVVNELEPKNSEIVFNAEEEFKKAVKNNFLFELFSDLFANLAEDLIVLTESASEECISKDAKISEIIQTLVEKIVSNSEKANEFFALFNNMQEGEKNQSGIAQQLFNLKKEWQGEDAEVLNKLYSLMNEQPKENAEIVEKLNALMDKQPGNKNGEIKEMFGLAGKQSLSKEDLIDRLFALMSAKNADLDENTGKEELINKLQRLIKGQTNNKLLGFEEKEKLIKNFYSLLKQKLADLTAKNENKTEGIEKTISTNVVKSLEQAIFSLKKVIALIDKNNNGDLKTLDDEIVYLIKDAVNQREKGKLAVRVNNEESSGKTPQDNNTGQTRNSMDIKNYGNAQKDKTVEKNETQESKVILNTQKEMNDNTKTLENNIKEGLKEIFGLAENEEKTDLKFSNKDFSHFAKQALTSENVQKQYTESVQQAKQATQTQQMPQLEREVLSQIVNKAAYVMGENRQEMMISLKPEYLGNMSMKISTHNGVVTAEFIAESQQVKYLLESNMQFLKDSLEKQGMIVDEFSVSVGKDFLKKFNQERAFANRNAYRMGKIGESKSGVSIASDYGYEVKNVKNPYALEYKIDLTA